MKIKFQNLACWLMCTCLIITATACSTTEKNSNKPVIAVSIVPEAFFVTAICKDHARVVIMIPSGSSPENYEPSAKEVADFQDADLYFSIGVPTEETNILPKLNQNTKRIALNDVVSKVYDERTFISGERDPHIWLSPKRAKVMVETIRDEMIALDPSHQSEYTLNAKELLNQLDAVDLEVKAALHGVKNAAFIVYHPAFGYLADDYGLTMYALEQEGKEATPEHLKKMIDFAKENNIKVLFYQAEIDSSQSRAFAEEIGGKTAMLSPLSADYINNLRTMAKTLAEGLGNE